MYANSKTSQFRFVFYLFLSLCASAGCRRADAREERNSAGLPAGLASASLTDQDGRALNVSEFRGKTLVFSLFFTSCPSVCPIETRALADVQRRLPAAVRTRVAFLSLSVDPENDTPDALKRFALVNGADLGGWSFVRAGEKDTYALMTELAAFDPRTNAPTRSNHSTSVYLFAGDGRLMQRFAGSPLDVPRLAREIESLDAWFQKKKDVNSP